MHFKNITGSMSIIKRNNIVNYKKNLNKLCNDFNIVQFSVAGFWSCAGIDLDLIRLRFLEVKYDLQSQLDILRTSF